MQQDAGAPVSAWLIDAVAPQPGHVLLEVAAGPGDTGFLAAELIRPGGRLICTDGAEAMVEAARARAAELGIENVEFSPMEAEWLDMPTASVDGDPLPLGLHAARRSRGRASRGAARPAPGWAGRAGGVGLAED